MLNKNMVGIIVGAFFGLFHLAWGLLVAIGLAQIFMDFIYQIHMLNNPFIIQPFNLGLTITLIIVTTAFGYIFGWVFAWLWDIVQKKK